MKYLLYKYRYNKDYYLSNCNSDNSGQDLYYKYDGGNWMKYSDYEHFIKKRITEGPNFHIIKKYNNFNKVLMDFPQFILL